MSLDGFKFPKYEVRRKFFSLFGRSCDIYNLKEELVFEARLKPFQFKKDVYLHFVQAESPEVEALLLEAKTIGGLNAVYDVIDPVTGGSLGVISRKGLKKFLKNEWTLIGLDGREKGTVREDSVQDAVMKRLFGSPLPQRYTGRIGETPVCTFDQNLGVFSFSVTVRFLPASEKLLDRRMGLAVAILLCLVEGRQRPLIGNI